jgi:hypothetical protein
MLTAIIIVVPLGALAIIWKFAGLGAGRKFGNSVAAHLGIEPNVFHSILDNGVKGPSLVLLKGMSNLPPQLAAVELAPSLARGLAVLESRFGDQPQLAHAASVIRGLVSEWDHRSA